MQIKPLRALKVGINLAAENKQSFQTVVDQGLDSKYGQSIAVLSFSLV